MAKDWPATIRGWLETGKDSSKNLVGLPWELEDGVDDEYHYVMASHPKIPFAISIYISQYFANLYIRTNIETDAYDVRDRMRLYKTLLHMNSDSNLFKVGLMDKTDKIILAVDLDLASLNKEEFNDALSALLAGTYKVIEALDLEEEFEKQMFEKLAVMVLEKLREGQDEEQVKDFLIKRVGMSKTDAKNLIESIVSYINKEDDDSKKKSQYYIS